MRITRIETIALHMPYQEQILEHLRKGWGLGNRATDEQFAAERPRFEKEFRTAQPPSIRTTIYRVYTDEDLVGLGEGAALDKEQLAGYIGHSPFEYIMDDSVGPLQIAFYDLMGQALDLPLARVIGPARDRAPLAWWSHCFPPDVLQSEAQRAQALGYRVHKFKRRAHTDVVAQIAAIAAVTPDDYEITIDANETFGTVERALDVCARLKKFPQLHCLESPIEQSDIAGYRRLHAELGLPLAHHIGTPDVVEALYCGVYDYFILGATIAATVRSGAIANTRNKPFWMQLGGDGTDISTLFMLHLAAAVPNATKGHVSMQHLQTDILLTEPLQVVDGEVMIPQTPGLGGTLNMDVVDKYRV
ncbi:MAG: mandelate racemase/muconate lactonizing enzyme family protein [bacterium]|nr:mandelate racemase/muconate lactonizing enzyme family protein [bacterium]